MNIDDQKSIIQAIDDEPELPGDIPLEMLSAIRKAVFARDNDFLVRAFRSTVRMTKQGIKERMKERGLIC